MKTHHIFIIGIIIAVVIVGLIWMSKRTTKFKGTYRTSGNKYTCKCGRLNKTCDSTYVEEDCTKCCAAHAKLEQEHLTY